MSEERENTDARFWRVAGIFALMTTPLLLFAAGALLFLLTTADQGNYPFVLFILVATAFFVGIPLVMVTAIAMYSFVLWAARKRPFG